MWKPDTMTARFLELTKWLRGLGVCQLCSLRMAIAAVERESKRTWKASATCPRPRQGLDSSGRRIELPGCEDIARKHWDERPKKG